MSNLIMFQNFLMFHLWTEAKRRKKKMFNKPNYFSKTTDYNVGGVFWDLLCLNFSFQILSSNS